ncbi:MAG: DUF4339 domain-containing protein [Thermoguttaceae bacterium]
MTPVEWYYARDNKQMGPVSAAELKRLATAGELRPEDLVWREGMTEWSLARNVRGLFEEEAKPTAAGGSAVKIVEAVQPAPAVIGAGEGAAPRRHLFDTLLDAARPHFNAQFIAATAKMFRACGSYGLLAAMVAIAAFTGIVASKTGELDHLLPAAVLIVMLAAAQYVAGRLCEALDESGHAPGDKLGSTVVPDCVALLALAGGVTALVISVSLAVVTGHYPLVLFGITVCLICGFLAAIAINPTALGISIERGGSVGQQAIGVLSFLLKAFVQLVPVAFGAGVICGVLLYGYACGACFSGENGLRIASGTAGAAGACLRWSAFLPVIGYVLFLLVGLVLDLCRSLLRIPPSLDDSAVTTHEPKSGT